MIKLIKGYPYDNTYDYIKLHANKTEQENYFNTFDHIFVDEDFEEVEEGYLFEDEDAECSDDEEELDEEVFFETDMFKI